MSQECISIYSLIFEGNILRGRNTYAHFYNADLQNEKKKPVIF